MANAMTYSDIRDIMLDKGLAADPAFRKVNFAIVDSQLPCLEEGCPLGLYFPEQEFIKEIGLVPERTIVLPYDCSEGVLLHELGHHWGNWYKHNLTENFAEDFRRKYGGYQPLMACGKMACSCGECRLEKGWACVPKMRLNEFN